jgi:hypothetical protein
MVWPFAESSEKQPDLDKSREENMFAFDPDPQPTALNTPGFGRPLDFQSILPLASKVGTNPGASLFQWKADPGTGDM